MIQKLCDELVFSAKPIRQCANPAKYRHQLRRYCVENLCGVHARRYQGSPDLIPLNSKFNEKYNGGTDD